MQINQDIEVKETPTVRTYSGKEIFEDVEEGVYQMVDGKKDFAIVLVQEIRTVIRLCPGEMWVGDCFQNCPWTWIHLPDASVDLSIFTHS